jgi:hypothetical protein
MVKRAMIGGGWLRLFYHIAEVLPKSTRPRAIPKISAALL